jgi:sugar/nucleoside kinase (ribokinase family)
VLREHGMTAVPFVYEITPSLIPEDVSIENVAVALNGTSLIILTPKGEQPIAVNAMVAIAKSMLEPRDTDMEVLYVGQALGRSGSRTALDRLLSHKQVSTNPGRDLNAFP